MGPAGAHVRCPSCRGVFAVAPDGTVHELGGSPASGAPRGAGAEPAAPAAAPAIAATVEDPDQVARALVGELASRAGDAPGEAFARGRLFSEWGPALGELIDEYRRRVGSAPGGAALRAALRERWGIDLPDGFGG